MAGCGAAADENPAAEELASGADASLNAFFDHAGLELAAAAGGGQGADDDEEEELEWLSNMDAFPSVETMSAEVEAAPSAAPPARLEPLPHASHAVGPRTKGLRRRRRVTAPWSVPPVLPPPAGSGAPRRRCTHCASEETPQWRQGPAGPSTLCNACGVRFKSGRLFPEYRPILSPTFSPLLHSNSHRRVMEMRRHVEAEEAAPAAGRAGARVRRAERAAARAAKGE
ncbi:GATA transcription factor 10 [Zea mays]|uniref:GATA transcription factor 10 n=2 Tax=Zea mays TaxID=4577 RepID=A0A8J8XPL9_MAIZE|nr:GATA transcription factor 4 [Zea mays]AQL09541.1 Putative GATA transcription factor family protein [Zea mays]PWZ07982.1 GATA transcription factor 10 [Zea mays]|eukprot:XP_020400002.1 GATA transcription factor 4 [Zea mays]